MSQNHDWNDLSRETLRASMRSFIRGELRLMKRSPEAIIDACLEACLENRCPESEQGVFAQFAADEIIQIQVQLATEMSAWPTETDCDRLDLVEATLRDRDVLLWQVSPCCDTCTRSELPDRIQFINDRHPGFRDRIRGYAFFIEQSMPELLSDNTELSVFLGYGWFARDDSEVEAAEEVYERNAVGIAHEVSDCLREGGFEVIWDGTLARKIGLCINWQRRHMLD